MLSGLVLKEVAATSELTGAVSINPSLSLRVAHWFSDSINGFSALLQAISTAGIQMIRISAIHTTHSENPFTLLFFSESIIAEALEPWKARIKVK